MSALPVLAASGVALVFIALSSPVGAEVVAMALLLATACVCAMRAPSARLPLAVSLALVVLWCGEALRHGLALRALGGDPLVGVGVFRTNALRALASPVMLPAPDVGVGLAAAGAFTILVALGWTRWRRMLAVAAAGLLAAAVAVVARARWAIEATSEFALRVRPTGEGELVAAHVVPPASVAEALPAEWAVLAAAAVAALLAALSSDQPAGRPVSAGWVLALAFAGVFLPPALLGRSVDAPFLSAASTLALGLGAVAVMMPHASVQRAAATTLGVVAVITIAFHGAYA